MASNGETAFQAVTRSSVASLLEESGLRVYFEVQDGNECVLYLTLPEIELEIWIYEDELEFRHHGKQFLYERDSSTDLDKLRIEFLQQLKLSLSTG